MMDSDALELAKNWLDSNGIEATDPRLNTLAELLEKAWQDGYGSGFEYKE